MWAAEATAKINIPLKENIIKKGEKITITKGNYEHYALWHPDGIYDLPEKYVDRNSIKILKSHEKAL